MSGIYARYIELILLIILALISDIKTYKVKNIVIIIFVFVGLTTNLLLYGISGIASSAFALLLPFALLFFLYALKMLGAGDIKLFCAIGAIAGVEFVLYDIAISFFSGGVIAIIIMLSNRNFRQRGLYFLNYIKTCFLTFSLKPYTDFADKSDGSKFRFTYAIACGTAIVSFMSYH